jgi:predicted Zn-dependent peptidase
MIIERKLSNGIPVIFDCLPEFASVAVGVFVRAGAADETLSFSGVPADGAPATGIPGISHLIEHMVFKGTAKRTAKQIAEDIDRTGGQMNAFTGKELTCFYVKSLSEHADVAIDVLSDILSSASLDEGEMAKEKNVILEEIKMYEDTPDDFGFELIEEAVHAGSKYGNRIIGSPESVLSVSREDIKSYMKTYYAADNMLISVSGCADTDALIEMLEKGFGGFEAAGAKRSVPGIPHKPVYISKKKDIEQSHIFFGTRGPGRLSEDFYAQAIYSSVLGGSMSSRLFQKIREELGLAYSVSAQDLTYTDDGAFVIHAAVCEGKERDTADAVREVLGQLAAGDAKEEEIDKAKEQCKAGYIFGLESCLGRMVSNGRAMLLRGRIIPAEEIIERTSAVSMKDFLTRAELYAGLEDYSAVIVGAKEFAKGEIL